jgi:hypothetical protein
MAWGGTLENITMGGIGTDGSNSWLGLEVEVQDEKAYILRLATRWVHLKSVLYPPVQKGSRAGTVVIVGFGQVLAIKC